MLYSTVVCVPWGRGGRGVLDLWAERLPDGGRQGGCDVCTLPPPPSNPPILTSNYKNKNQDDPSLVHVFLARDFSGQEQLQNKYFFVCL